MGSNLLIIVVVVAFGGMMWWQSRKAKKQQNDIKNFRESLEPGTEVITIGGVIGKVVSVDARYEEIVIDSEGSELRFTFRAISKEYTRPAYVDDEDEGDEAAQAPVSADDDQAQIEDGSDDQAQLPLESEGSEAKDPAREQDSTTAAQ